MFSICPMCYTAFINTTVHGSSTVICNFKVHVVVTMVAEEEVQTKALNSFQ